MKRLLFGFIAVSLSVSIYSTIKIGMADENEIDLFSLSDNPIAMLEDEGYENDEMNPYATPVPENEDDPYGDEYGDEEERKPEADDNAEEDTEEDIDEDEGEDYLY